MTIRFHKTQNGNTWFAFVGDVKVGHMHMIPDGYEAHAYSDPDGNTSKSELFDNPHDAEKFIKANWLN